MFVKSCKRLAKSSRQLQVPKAKSKRLQRTVAKTKG